MCNLLRRLPRHEIIVPSLTYIATANAVRYCGATPVLVDSEPRTWNICPEAIERAVTPRTRGIIVVHLYGHPVDFDAIQAIALRHRLFIIEDAAEAHGALYKGRPIGSLGDLATFSFYGNKILTTGEGGMVLTSDAGLAEKVRLLRGQGMDPARRYWFPVIGYNYRMTNIQAAIGLAQLETVEEHLEAHRRVAAWYQQHLAALDCWIARPLEEPWARHVFWMYTILLKSLVKTKRDDVMAELDARGVETRPIFYPLQYMPPYATPRQHLPVAEDIAARGMNLPTHGLVTEDDVVYIVQCLKEICAR